MSAGRRCSRSSHGSKAFATSSTRVMSLLDESRGARRRRAARRDAGRARTRTVAPLVGRRRGVDAPLPRGVRARASPRGEEFIAVDAAHMLAIAAPDFDARLAWTERGIEFAQASSDPEVNGWLGSLYNNAGWDRFDDGDYQTALDWFERALVERERRPDQPDRIAHAPRSGRGGAQGAERVRAGRLMELGEAVSLLEQLVEIESPTYSPGVEHVATLMTDTLAALGFCSRRPRRSPRACGPRRRRRAAAPRRTHGHRLARRNARDDAVPRRGRSRVRPGRLRHEGVPRRGRRSRFRVEDGSPRARLPDCGRGARKPHGPRCAA